MACIVLVEIDVRWLDASLAKVRTDPWLRPSHHPDVALAAAIAVLLGLLVLPVPPRVLDFLLATNIAAAALVLVAVLLAERPLALSTFPSLLLVTTLARLALNVSSTRLILGRGRAGELVEAFGQFVVRGDVVMGLVVFSILVLVQLLVIGKGAERVAEVGARFTLDALPGRQMSIDAALRAGTLTDEEAAAQRSELQRESQFHGAMDGAMKFVKGDAIAGIVITLLNLGAGLAIGVMRHEMDVLEAVERFSILTVGDGLVAQIPALFVTLSAGVLTTRVASETPRLDLGRSLGRELFGRPKVLGIAAGFCVMLACIPGLPALPFACVALALIVAAARGAASGGAPADGRAHPGLERRLRVAESPKVAADPAPTVSPIGVDLDPRLSDALAMEPGRENRSELVRELLPQLRNAIFLETGVRLPGIRVRSGTSGLPAGAFVVRLKEVPVAADVVESDAVLVLEPEEKLAGLPIEVQPATHPVHGTGASRVPTRDAPTLVEHDIPFWRPAGVVALHVARVARAHLAHFVGLHETHDMVERLRPVYPALVAEVVPRLVSLAQLADVLRRLVEERVSIRDLKTILEALAERGERPTDTRELTEHVRAALALQLVAEHTGSTGRLEVILLDGELEELVRAALVPMDSGPELTMLPDVRRAVLEAFAAVAARRRPPSEPPVVLTQPDIRSHVRQLLEPAFPSVVALSVRELPARLVVEPVGTVKKPDTLG